MYNFNSNITLKDVAELAGVSVATVSRVLNGLSGYSEETHAKVLKIVETTGYQRNAVARNLKTKKTNSIAVLLPKVETTYYTAIMNGIEDAALKSGYSVMICHVGDSGNRTKEYIRMLGERQVDGIIGCSLPPKEDIDALLYESRIPSVLVSTLSCAFHVPFVKVDDFRAEYAATEYMIHKGHRKIAFLSGTLGDVVAGLPRLEGYRKALADNALEYDESFVAYTGFSYESGVEAMNQLLDRRNGFTAVVACSDEVAIAAIAAGYAKGLSVPQNFSVIGYDNTHLAEMSIPPLTTVSQPLYRMGTEAFEMLLQIMKDGRQVEDRILPFEIIERQSVASQGG